MSILDDAKALVYGPREADYDHPRKDFEGTAQMVQGFLRRKLVPGCTITADDVAAILICVKLSRLSHRYKRDSVVDLAGYAACWARLHEDDE